MSNAGYDLWDVETGNMIGTFETEDEALRLVHDLLEANGVDYAGSLDLGRIDADGGSHSIATGAALLARVRALTAKDLSFAAEHR